MECHLNMTQCSDYMSLPYICVLIQLKLDNPGNWAPVLNPCFEHWGELNNLHLNVSKIRLLIAGSSSKLSNMGAVNPLRLYEKDVIVVKEYNYLGVILDSEMSLRPFSIMLKRMSMLRFFLFLNYVNV